MHNLFFHSIGPILLLYVIWALWSGKAWNQFGHIYDRDESPGSFWFIVVFYGIVAAVFCYEDIFVLLHRVNR